MNYDRVSKNIIQEIDGMFDNSRQSIVYDIDGTLIADNGELIVPIYETYVYALEKGIAPVIITAREGSDKNIMLTKQQLSSLGITDYVLMYFRQPGMRSLEEIVRSKLEARKNVLDRGYNTIISIGDNWWDIGEYGGKGFIVG
jgi:hypothetical protein